MSSINSFQFDIMRGLPANLKQRVSFWQTPSITGYGAQKLGYGDADFTIELTKYSASNSDANELINGIENLVSEITTFIDDYGDEYDNILITKFGTKIKLPCIFNGNESAVRVTIVIEACATDFQ